MNDFDELVRRIRIERARILLWIDQMGPNVVLDHFSHQAGDGTPYARDHMHDAFAFGFLSQRALDRLDLALDPTDAGKQSHQDGGVQLLKTVDQVAQTLTDDRYSAEQVNKIFRRLSDGIPKERIEQSLERQPLLQLLVHACGKLDCLERHENANKRWSGRVERDLRKKLFAMEWGIDLDDYSGEA